MANKLPADAVVVRGGMSRDPDVLLSKLREAVSDGDGAVLSVYCAAVGILGRTSAIHEAVVCGDIPHGRVQVATAGALAAAGFTLTQYTADGEPDCHYHASFGNDWRPIALSSSSRASMSRYPTR